MDKVLLEAIDPMGGKAINVSSDCGADRLKSADLFIVQRKTFLEAPATLQGGLARRTGRPRPHCSTCLGRPEEERLGHDRQAQLNMESLFPDFAK
ncbi:hypothetical protein [Mesorhizobium sp.]|uniref:hypothetical protein n=1 Tax=Mesorhizobium sp. TaxID=1871066 RepID=UPI000FE6357D|nr:hypothetical protein [Mesorhizobium sp.]RWI16729.1 MAG: hypothetical protein EOQ94_29310 [Mesorhizobium sp.]RWN08782.1 MAG: hypothetical protein EOR87_21185 [Mesorhizobium sp.]RWN16207.1 MAG: hypothetical protein EOR88_17120 [Mesorhizobium sp.]TIQ97491.1 MAG: hypothetical protein E5X36_13150 [Mesorhizobium sp.]